MKRRDSQIEYSKDFFEGQHIGSLASSRKVVPVVLEFVQPRSVLDVGTGVGSWLRAFHENGVTDVLGVDGEYVARDMLQIQPDAFVAADLRKPLILGREFDLVVSLEVAEHLPETCARQFVESLVRHGPVVLFSAAIPHQWGTHHINEQWPEYWVRLFGEFGYEVVDCIRAQIWSLPGVEACYQQNILFFASERGLDQNPKLAQAFRNPAPGPLAIAHPWWYSMHADPNNAYISKSIPRVGKALRNVVRRRLGR